MDLKISRISATSVNSDRTGEWRLMLHAWSFANNRQLHGVIQNYWVSAFVDCAPEQIRIERQKYWRIKGTRMSIYIRIIIVDKRAVSSANRLVMTNRYHARYFSRRFVHKNVKVSLSNERLWDDSSALGNKIRKDILDVVMRVINVGRLQPFHIRPFSTSSLIIFRDFWIKKMKSEYKNSK